MAERSSNLYHHIGLTRGRGVPGVEVEGASLGFAQGPGRGEMGIGAVKAWTDDGKWPRKKGVVGTSARGDLVLSSRGLMKALDTYGTPSHVKPRSPLMKSLETAPVASMPHEEPYRMSSRQLERAIRGIQVAGQARPTPP
ncbi:uncharacterized protein PSFLO_02380 [Pseudozyma flocculosa]|uniref:Uncharacterized protein n=1 Tax=Pseudozyma flocculosa TaxID=84751 RepID=A0A5C3F0E6_9BASI|nr:uncharacterized protein PSFLO_02380 [Pseudozyma flocculosa]